VQNRINIEVLSVIATQVKMVLDAQALLANPANRPPEFVNAPGGVIGMFELMGDVIQLVPTVGSEWKNGVVFNSTVYSRWPSVYLFIALCAVVIALLQCSLR
jgi:hypothetical protein